MTDLITVDVLGNIYVHTQVGVKIPIVDQDAAGNPISLAGKTWLFKMPGVSKPLLVDAGNPDGLILEITPAEAEALPAAADTPFIVIDETGEERWTAKIKRRGW